jgi:hypothetical protein
MIGSHLLRLFIRHGLIRENHAEPYLTGRGDTYLFGTRNRKEFFISLLTSFSSEVSLTLDADEILARIDADSVPSSFTFLFPLGKAYWVRSAQPYADAFRNSIVRWIETHEPGSSSWCQRDNMSRRIVNWITGYHFFADTGIPDIDFMRMFSRSLYLQGRWMAAETDRSERDRNVRLRALLAMQICGLFFANDASGKKWLTRSSARIDRLMEDEADPRTIDELFLERLDIYTISYLLSRINRLGRGEKTDRNLHRLYRVLASSSSPLPYRGEVIRYREADNPLKSTEMLPIAAVLYGDRSMKERHPHFSEYALWLLGAEGFERFRAI